MPKASSMKQSQQRSPKPPKAKNRFFLFAEDFRPTYRSLLKSRGDPPLRYHQRTISGVTSRAWHRLGATNPALLHHYGTLQEVHKACYTEELEDMKNGSLLPLPGRGYPPPQYLKKVFLPEDRAGIMSPEVKKAALDYCVQEAVWFEDAALAAKQESAVNTPAAMAPSESVSASSSGAASHFFSASSGSPSIAATSPGSTSLGGASGYPNPTLDCIHIPQLSHSITPVVHDTREYATAHVHHHSYGPFQEAIDFEDTARQGSNANPPAVMDLPESSSESSSGIPPYFFSARGGNPSTSGAPPVSTSSSGARGDQNPTVAFTSIQQPFTSIPPLVNDARNYSTAQFTHHNYGPFGDNYMYYPTHGPAMAAPFANTEWLAGSQNPNVNPGSSEGPSLYLPQVPSDAEVSYQAWLLSQDVESLSQLLPGSPLCEEDKLLRGLYRNSSG